MSAPLLLRCRGARIEVSGAVLLDGLDVDATGPRVVLVGSWEPLFRLWSRTATLSRGSVNVLGREGSLAVRENRLGIAPADAPIVPSFRVVESLAASARLLGLGRRAAKMRAEATLDRLGLRALARERLGAVDRAARRAVSIAAAVLGDPPAIAIERPYAGLTDERALTVEAVLERAAEGRQLLLNLAAPATAGPEARALAAAWAEAARAAEAATGAAAADGGRAGAVVVLRAGRTVVATSPSP